MSSDLAKRIMQVWGETRNETDFARRFSQELLTDIHRESKGLPPKTPEAKGVPRVG